MTGLPPIPPWDAFHPLVVHFPIALLIVAPLFVILGAVLGRSPTGRAMTVAALILMALGTVGTFAAAATGDAAARVAQRSPQINAVLDRHEELAETTRAVFALLTAIFAVLVVAGRDVEGARRRSVETVLPLAFLALYATGLLLLVRTAHGGGTLVHQMGLRRLTAEPAAVVETHSPGAATLVSKERMHD